MVCPTARKARNILIKPFTTSKPVSGHGTGGPGVYPPLAARERWEQTTMSEKQTGAADMHAKAAAADPRRGAAANPACARSRRGAVRRLDSGALA
jgi:hypothetical protein